MENNEFNQNQESAKVNKAQVNEEKVNQTETEVKQAEFVENEPKKGLSVTALVLGIISIVCVFLAWTIIAGIIGAILGVAGIIFGIISLKKAKSGIGIAGLVTSIVGLVLCVIIATCAGCVLAGTAMAVNQKSNNIISNTEKFVDETKKLMIYEQIKTAVTTAKAESIADSIYGYGSSTLKDDELRDALENNVTEYYTVYGSEYSGWTVTSNGTTWNISTSGEITEQ